MLPFKSFLTERLIMFSNGARYGQIVFLAGGAGSGKGFAASNFMQGEIFKTRDVDAWKSAFLKIAKLKKKYPEIRGLDLRKPDDVFKLHQFVDSKKIKDKTMQHMLSSMGNKETLPNILFDITAKDVKSVAKLLPDLLNAGYNPANIHMLWVLTSYKVAVKNNAERDRVVPSDILLQTHKGAANTMFSLIRGTGKKLAINGAIHVLLNNRENTIFFPNSKTVIKDFKYLTMKKRGKPINKDIEMQKQLFQWIVDNVPPDTIKKAAEDL